MLRALLLPAFVFFSAIAGPALQEARAANVVALSCGSAVANGSFSADNFFLNGTTSTVNNTIDTSAVQNPAPMAVYQSNRYGNFSYSIPGLAAGAAYLVRLHFSETYWASPGARTFNVLINSTQVLTNFDIFTAAGGKNIATMQQFQAVADSNGKINIQFTTVTDNAEVSGIEVALAAAPPAPSYNLIVSSDRNSYSVGATATVLVGLIGAPTNPDYDFFVGATFRGAPLGLTALTPQQSYAITPALQSGTSVFVATVYLENKAQAAALNQAIAFYNSDITSLTTRLNGTSDPNTQATLRAAIARDQARLAATQTELINSRQQIGVPYLFNISAQ